MGRNRKKAIVSERERKWGGSIHDEVRGFSGAGSHRAWQGESQQGIGIYFRCNRKPPLETFKQESDMI